MASLAWFPIKKAYDTKIIGAAAYQGDTLIVVTAFYGDKDMDDDGKLGIYERLNPFGMQGRAMMACFTGLKSSPDLWMKDPNAVNQGWARSFVGLGTGLIADGIYIVYFNRAIGSMSGMAASGFTTNPVKSFVIKKGMEKVVKEAYRSGTR
jgi:hypothetical protein